MNNFLPFDTPCGRSGRTGKNINLKNKKTLSHPLALSVLQSVAKENVSKGQS